MDSQVTVVVEHGHIPLTPEMQRVLSIPDVTPVKHILVRGSIIVQPLVHHPLKAMQDLFVGADYSLEEDLRQMRREEEEHSRQKYGC